MPTYDLLICHSTFWLIFIKRHVLHFTKKKKQKRLSFPNHYWTEWTSFTIITQQISCEKKASKVSNLRCGWSCQEISVTSVTFYDPRLERIRCMKSRQSFSRLTRLAGVWGSRTSHSRITLPGLRAFQKRPKTTVLQSIARAFPSASIINSIFGSQGKIYILNEAILKNILIGEYFFIYFYH